MIEHIKGLFYKTKVNVLNHYVHEIIDSKVKINWENTTNSNNSVGSKQPQ